MTVPRGGLGVDTVSLMTGNISVRQVEFDGLDVKVAWGRDGAWRIAEGSEDNAPVAQGAPGGAGGAGGAGDMLGNLDRLVLRDAQVTLVNERLGKSMAIDHVSGDFGRRGDVDVDEARREKPVRTIFDRGARGCRRRASRSTSTPKTLASRIGRV